MDWYTGADCSDDDDRSSVVRNTGTDTNTAPPKMTEAQVRWAELDFQRKAKRLSTLHSSLSFQQTIDERDDHHDDDEQQQQQYYSNQSLILSESFDSCDSRSRHQTIPSRRSRDFLRISQKAYEQRKQRLSSSSSRGGVIRPLSQHHQPAIAGNKSPLDEMNAVELNNSTVDTHTAHHVNTSLEQSYSVYGRSSVPKRTGAVRNPVVTRHVPLAPLDRSASWLMMHLPGCSKPMTADSDNDDKQASRRRRMCSPKSGISPWSMSYKKRDPLAVQSQKHSSRSLVSNSSRTLPSRRRLHNTQTLVEGALAPNNGGPLVVACSSGVDDCDNVLDQPSSLIAPIVTRDSEDDNDDATTTTTTCIHNLDESSIAKDDATFSMLFLDSSFMLHETTSSTSGGSSSGSSKSGNTPAGTTPMSAAVHVVLDERFCCTTRPADIQWKNDIKEETVVHGKNATAIQSSAHGRPGATADPQTRTTTSDITSTVTGNTEPVAVSESFFTKALGTNQEADGACHPDVNKAPALLVAASATSGDVLVEYKTPTMQLERINLSIEVNANVSYKEGTLIEANTTTDCLSTHKVKETQRTVSAVTVPQEEGSMAAAAAAAAAASSSTDASGPTTDKQDRKESDTSRSTKPESCGRSQVLAFQTKIMATRRDTRPMDKRPSRRRSPARRPAWEAPATMSGRDFDIRWEKRLMM
jgi:hypothetical protein